MSESQSVRQEGQGFLDEEGTYLKKLAESKLPPELEHLRHKIPWPVDTANPQAHLVLFFGDVYSLGSNNQYTHTGVDVQVPAGTKVFTPESGTIVDIDPENAYSGGPRRKLTDIILFGDSGLIYNLSHLLTPSVPSHLMEIYRTNIKNLQEGLRSVLGNVRMEKGEYLGEVGVFTNKYAHRLGFTGLPKNIATPEDVKQVYGSTYDHLHIEISNTPQSSYWYKKIRLNLSFIDPLPLLQKLY